MRFLGGNHDKMFSCDVFVVEYPVSFLVMRSERNSERAICHLRCFSFLLPCLCPGPSSCPLAFWAGLKCK